MKEILILFLLAINPEDAIAHAVGEFQNFSAPEIVETSRVVALMNSTLSSACFANAWNASRDLVETQGKSSAEVLLELREAESVTLEQYSGAGRTVAWTIPGEKLIRINRRRYGREDDCGKADTLLHEIAHVKTFLHSRTKTRARSVPYTAGRVLQGCCR